MESQVEKMYKNAGVEPDYDYFTLFDDKVHKIGRTMHLCKKELKHWLENYQKDYVAIKVIRVDKEYPPFTAEKQLELYKYLCKLFLITTRYYFDEFSITAENTFEWKTMTKVSATGKTYEECIAKLVNNILQDLTAAEKAQIRGILE